MNMPQKKCAEIGSHEKEKVGTKILYHKSRDGLACDLRDITFGS